MSKAQKEPSVDFELDVKVDIESGKCTLHPKEPKIEIDSEPRRSGVVVVTCFAAVCSLII